MKVRHILAPTDFSDDSIRLLKFATELAEHFNAKLTLMNAYFVADSDERDKSIKMLEGVAKILRKNGYKGELNLVVRQGFITEEITECCLADEVDLLLMGTKGASGIKSLLVGSKTATVIEKTSIPTLIIPYKFKYRAIENIIFATDLNPADFNSGMDLIAFAKAMKAYVHVLHISEKDKEAKENYRKLSKMTQTISEKSGYDKLMAYEVISEEVHSGIRMFQKEKHAEILALTTQNRSMLEKLFSTSITKEMALLAEVPLLVFHK